MFFNSKFTLFAIYFIAIYTIITPATASNIWVGTVKYVVDGDTLHVLPVGLNDKSKARKIRVEGIDAPEICQQYGKQSTAALKKFIYSKQVTVISKRFDDYGRELAKITFENQDVGSWMVRRGHAWSYHSERSSGPYRVEEETAMQLHMGLFADSTAIEPRIFRRENGSCFAKRAKNDHKRSK